MGNSSFADVSLGDIVDFRNGKAIPPEKYTPDGKHPVFGSNGQIACSDEVLCPDPTIVIGRVGAYCGCVHYVPRASWVTDNAIVALPQVGNDIRYLYYLLGSLELERTAIGSAQPLMTQKGLKIVQTKVPPLPEQKAIAHILGSLDDKIELNRKMNATLEAMAQALFKSWFVNFDPVIDNALAAGNPIPETLAARAEVRRQAIADGTANREVELSSKTFVESDLGLIPNDYEIQTIEQCCTFVSRGVTPKYELGSGRFIINQKVNRGAELDLSNLKELTNSLTVSAEKHAQSHDVLVNCLGEGTLGRVHFYNGAPGIYAVDQHMTICRPNTPEFGLYLYQYLASPVGQERIESAKTGSTGMTMFNIKKVRSFQIPLPSRKALKAYGNETLDLYMKIQENRNQNLILTKLRDTLLPKLISGELRVSEAEPLTEGALA
jgi:type I restriction enzyme S subunit